MRPAGRREHGFTLVELMLVLAIAGIIAAVALNPVRNYLASWDAHTSVRNIAGQVILARMRAASNFSWAQVYCNTSASPQTCQVRVNASGGNSTTFTNEAGATVIVPASGSVVINVLNNSGSSTPINVNGGTVSNGGGNPDNLSLVYAGNKAVNLAAGANMFATIYAPNAPVTVTGNAGLYGAVVANTVSFSGSGHLVYDTHLASVSTNIPIPGGAPAGPVHLDQFSWTMNYTPQE